ncbi:hypothetical protein BTUL_0125g00400 [Botrytis tulipae]|uniref:Uncharacterized protein n=1 Tax=Botrytis tulipae TaxID=87230 RepID=A0A4Z1EF07_9HELO|nr:hypothetical protein BTUL_0125g00400 [Botrytis tulipae]
MKGQHSKTRYENENNWAACFALPSQLRIETWPLEPLEGHAVLLESVTLDGLDVISTQALPPLIHFKLTISTSLTTGKTKHFTDSGQDNTKLLVLEQILKELREVSSHLRKQETRLSSVENGLRERSKLVDGKPSICGVGKYNSGVYGQIIRYIIGAQESNTGSQNINCLDSAPTPCPVGTPNSRSLVGPWKRVISCPEPRSTNLAQELGRREDKGVKYQTIPRTVRRTTPMDHIIFQIKYFEIHSVNQDEYSGIPWSQLKAGKLHSDKDEYCKDFSSGMPRILLESSYSLIALADKGCKQYWILLELKPMTFNKKISSVMHSGGTPQNALLTFFDYAIIAVSHMIQKWEQILEYFDNLITEKIAFLDPLKHDNLLGDDETFSRSKTPTIEGDEVRFLEGSRKHMRGRLGQLEEIAKRLRDKRQEALDLRDGLFNASGVMESRAATRLGENVKLLTFSVWSINDEIFSLRSLEIVATVVGLSTYLIVFNLDSLMNFSRALHRRFLIFAISMMKTEASDTTWGKRATIFEKFSIQREIEHKPSVWRLIQYLLYRALGMVGIIGKSTALFKHIKQRLSLATIASMKEARNPIWRGRAQRFEDAWAEKSTDKPSNWRMCQYILIKGTGFSLISACLYSSCGDQTVPQSSQSQTISGDLENQQN